MKKWFSSEKRGSALLIVLGFLAFIVVSGVSFAIYMRSERLSSSNYHRTVVVRQLLKAGLAHAIEEVDRYVGDAPFAGLGGNSNTYNYWPLRVYTPKGNVSPRATTPVLPLEGLAYLPPALVNEVRVQSRLTSTAGWQMLNYDAGRYAFVAVNVSDFFDCNKMRFSKGRTSGPNGHISLSYLYQNDRGTGWEGGSAASMAKQIDDFLDTRGGYESQVPFTSIADFNVALYSKDSSGSQTGICPAFYSYLSAGSANAFYSRGGDEQEDILKRARRGLFVTDSYSQPSNRTDVIDLQNREDQPFRESDFGAIQAKGAWGVLGESNGGKAIAGKGGYSGLKNDLHPISLLNLYDYLDEDSVPLSLAVPSVERAPMVGFIDANTMMKDMTMAVAKEEVSTDNELGGKTITTTYSLDPRNMANVIAGAAIYPFKHKRNGYSTTYTVQACMKIFFAPPGAACRAAISDLTPNRSDWQKNAETCQLDNSGRFITLISAPGAGRLNVKSSCSSHDDAVCRFTVKMPSLNSLGGNLKNMFLLRKVIKKDAKGKISGDITYESKISPLSLAGDNRVNGVSKVIDQKKLVNGEYVPYAAVWVRITDSNGDTVDLSPACFQDDNLNGTSAQLCKALQATSRWGAGLGYPLLLCEGAEKISYATDSVDGGFVKMGADYGAETKPFANSSACFVAPDPRFNYCPEDFYATADSLSDAGYVRMLEDDLLGRDGRDSDMFMTTSDQEYLQTIGELAFLPRLQDIGDAANGTFSQKAIDGHKMVGSLGEIPSGNSHKDCFWRTYRLYKQGNYQQDYIYDIPIVNGANDFRVNPYSDIERIRWAVTANTPCDYYCASTNEELSTVAKMKSIDEKVKYAFNELPGNVDSRLAWKDVTNITAFVFRHMRNDYINHKKNWEDSLAELSWYESDFSKHDSLFNDQILLSNTSAELDEIDREMLFSFWHDSMGCNQQLYLIFLRVEPTSFGTSNAELVPSQLSARAVALVWRDPWETPGAQAQSGTYVPHRMRLLFYHQFD